MPSQINPNNINGAYPVAGQDNNSQGFRDNFTNTITNFQYAKDEITALQNTAILQNQTNNIGNTVINGGIFKNTGGVTIDVSPTGNVATFSYSGGSYQTVSFNNTNGEIAFNQAAWPTAGVYASMRVQFTINQSNTVITLPVACSNSSVSNLSFRYLKNANVGNSTVVLNSIGTYVFEFWTKDSGASLFVNDLTRGANTTPV